MAIQTHCIGCNNKLNQPMISSVGILCRSCKEQGLFRKRIIITGMTRMNRGHICISGIDMDTLRFIRPVYSSGLQRNFIINGSGQQMKHFSIVEIEFKKYSPSHEYHTEDWLINEKFAPRYISQLNNEQIITLINKISIKNLNQAISEKISSLFIVKAHQILQLSHEYSFGKFKVRVTFEDSSHHIHFNIPATDLLLLSMVRYYVEVQRKDYEKEIITQFNNNPFRYIRIGLTREFRGQHWKQVTALITIPDLFRNRTFYDYEKKLGMCA